MKFTSGRTTTMRHAHRPRILGKTGFSELVYATRRIDLNPGSTPDTTTFLSWRRLLEADGLTRQVVGAIFVAPRIGACRRRRQLGLDGKDQVGVAVRPVGGAYVVKNGN